MITSYLTYYNVQNVFMKALVIEFMCMYTCLENKLLN